MELFGPLIILSVILKKVLDWLRVLIPDNLEAKVLIPASWVVGVALAFLFSASELLANGIEIWPGVTLADADIALVVAYGLALGSGAGVIHDFAKPTTPPHDAITWHAEAGHSSSSPSREPLI